MWPLLFLAGMFWMLSRSSITVGKADVPQLPGGAGIVQTIGFMRTLVNNAIDNPLIRRQAVKATFGCERGNVKCQAVALGDWVRNKMKYVPDPTRKENLANPAILAKAIDEGKITYGDCDDMSMYVAALAKSIGLKPMFKVVGRGTKYHHVYVEIDGVAIDPTVSLGTQPFDPQREMSLEV